MTMSIDASGVACCGACGANLKVVCEGGCPEPDIVFRKDYIASLPKPRGKEKPRRDHPPRVRFRARKPVPEHCTYDNCTDPIAPREPGAKGRPITRCVKHLEYFRKKREKLEVPA